MSTVKDIKTTKMLAAFNNAINFASEEDKPGLRKHCADAINRVTSTCYSISRNHVKQFVKVNHVWPDYVQHCGLLISALEVGHLYDPDNKTTIQNIIHISADNIQGMSFDAEMFSLLTKKVSVTEKYEALLRSKIDEYTTKMYRFDPGFVK